MILGHFLENSDLFLFELNLTMDMGLSSLSIMPLIVTPTEGLQNS